MPVNHRVAFPTERNDGGGWVREGCGDASLYEDLCAIPLVLFQGMDSSVL